MFDIDNDMDDLLRRAAENYPLTTGKDKWDDIQARLPQEPVKRVAVALPGIVISCVLLLFILHFSMATADLNLLYKRSANNQIFKDASIASQAAIANDNKTLPGLEPDHSVKKTSNPEKIIVQINNKTGFRKSAITVNEKLKAAGYVELVEFESKAGDILLSRQINSYTTISIPEKQKSLISSRGSHSIPIDSTSGLITASDAIKKKKAHIYASVTATVNVSTVKSMDPGKPGFIFGLLAGYQFSKRWSIETGLLYSKKMYKSEGKYFDTKEMRSSMPPGMELMDVKGYNHLIEIPLQVKYDFGVRAKHNFFSTAGFSSYMIILEKNQYNMMNNGVEEQMNGEYTDRKNYVAGSFNLSAGYELPAGKFRMRFEPFTQIPLKGMGIGKLPLTSFGFRIAIIR